MCIVFTRFFRHPTMEALRHEGIPGWDQGVGSGDPGRRASFNHLVELRQEEAKPGSRQVAVLDTSWLSLSTAGVPERFRGGSRGGHHGDST
jgi:hypothetical protein